MYSRQSSVSSLAEDSSYYVTLSNQLTGYLYCEVEEFCNTLSNNEENGAKSYSQNTNIGKWRYEGMKKGVTIYKSESEFQNKNPIPCLMGRIRMDCHPDYLGSYLTNPETRYYYDNSLKESKLLHQINDNLRLYYTAFQTKRCLVNYCVAITNIAAQRKEGGVHITGYCSVPQSAVAEAGVPTIWLHYSGFVVRPITLENNKIISDVFYIFQFDYKGDLPKFVINFAMERQMTQLAQIKLVIEKCLLSPTFSDAGSDPLQTVGRSSTRSSRESSRSGSNSLLRLPSTTSLGSIGCGRRIERISSFTSARSVVIHPKGGDSSPPVSMKSFSEPLLNHGDPLVVFYIDSSDGSLDRSNDSLMQSIAMTSPPDKVTSSGHPVTSSGHPVTSSGSSPPRTLEQGSVPSNVSLTDKHTLSELMEHQYLEKAKLAASKIHKEYIEIVESVRFSGVQHSTLPWKVIDQKRGVWILENTESDNLHICGVTRVETDCDSLINYLRDFNNKVEYEKFLHKVMLVEEINENLQILYLQFKTKHCLMVQYERDACVFQYISRKDKKAVLVLASVSHPNCPPTKGITRLKVNIGGFIIESLPTTPPQCSLVSVSNIEMGPGYFPHSLLWLIKRRQPLLLARIASHFKSG